MGNLEAVGDAVTGGMIGAAIEPATGADGHTHERDCLNCGTRLSGEYCHACGQRGHVHRTIAAFGHDLLHGVFHFEGKIWRTLPLLAWKPGLLTRRYIEGQRASYVSPIALFLFTVFLMFGVVSATGSIHPNWEGGSNLPKAEQESTQRLQKLSAERAQAVRAKQSTTVIDRQIEDEESGLKMIRSMRQQGVTGAVLNNPKSAVTSDIPGINEAYKKAKENPQLLIYKLKNNSYKWSWALIPLSLPILWLMFPFSRRFHAYDHIVFITYSLSFMTCLVIVGTLLSAAGVNAIAPIALLIPPVHMYRQLRGAYSLGWFGALWRTIVLATGSIAVLIIFIMGMVALGVLD